MALRASINGGEDTWIKNERGVYIPHGNPAFTPDNVKEQISLISGAMDLYFKKKNQTNNLSSECLGTVDGYAVDIAHEPRTTEDDKPENQCSDYRTGKVYHFIELDNTGRVIRII